ncbi:hypothetical protein OSB04_008927 [Centaurea solstitialis]|uniref:Pyrrolidone-carboxylate peptidase n=1 Tax=Centaurea solstitialis TaxID=347529 RepID=A0AA38WK02_9ASTR|nr:hypothetical protein OSB04_008927 [Centaurea solstitialis]
MWRSTPVEDIVAVEDEMDVVVGRLMATTTLTSGCTTSTTRLRPSERKFVKLPAILRYFNRIDDDIRGFNEIEMGSEAPKSVVIHVTGFKKFNVFATNPTEALVSDLRNGFAPGVSLGSCTVLETAGDGALATLYKVLESSVSSENKSGSEEVVWLHMGLNGGASKFAIERQAVNEATFSCPDELAAADCPEDGGLTRTRETVCAIDTILEFVKKTKGCDATISDDAGRFVCNYVYYHSLRFAEDKGHKSLFVHVPPFSRISEETQKQFMVALLEAIALSC